jgi:hypothetical protein
VAPLNATFSVESGRPIQLSHSLDRASSDALFSHENKSDLKVRDPIAAKFRLNCASQFDRFESRLH